MDKIVVFSNLGKTQTLEGKLESLKASLSNKNLNQKKLQRLKSEMNCLSFELSESLKQEVIATSALYDTWQKQQEELSALMNTCHNLSIDLCVNQLTVSAKKLAESTSLEHKHLVKKITKIEKKIKSLNFKEGLSLENRKLIQLAKDLLDSAKHPSQKVIPVSSPDSLRLDFKQEWTPFDVAECSELSLELFDVASLFYEYKLQQALIAMYRLPFYAQEKLTGLFKKNAVDIEGLQSAASVSDKDTYIYKIVEILLSYSQELVQGFSEPLSKKEIDSLFKDLYVNLMEPSANF
jgi:hypothetical protein